MYAGQKLKNKLNEEITFVMLHPSDEHLAVVENQSGETLEMPLVDLTPVEDDPFEDVFNSGDLEKDLVVESGDLLANDSVVEQASVNPLGIPLESQEDLFSEEDYGIAEPTSTAPVKLPEPFRDDVEAFTNDDFAQPVGCYASSYYKQAKVNNTPRSVRIKSDTSSIEVVTGSSTAKGSALDRLKDSLKEEGNYIVRVAGQKTTYVFNGGAEVCRFRNQPFQTLKQEDSIEEWKEKSLPGKVAYKLKEITLC